MKKIMLSLVALMFMGTTILTAQNAEKKDSDNANVCCNGRMWQDIPDLTQDQTEKIKDLQIAHLKEVNQLRNQVTEKKAHLRTLQSADKIDNTAINKTIDEITALQNDMMKKNENHRQSVRNLLTDKQKVVFDAKHCGKMHGNGSCCNKNTGNIYGHEHHSDGFGNGCCGKHEMGKGNCCK